MTMVPTRTMMATTVATFGVDSRGGELRCTLLTLRWGFMVCQCFDRWIDAVSIGGLSPF